MQRLLQILGSTVVDPQGLDLSPRVQGNQWLKCHDS